MYYSLLRVKNIKIYNVPRSHLFKSFIETTRIDLSTVTTGFLTFCINHIISMIILITCGKSVFIYAVAFKYFVGLL